MMCQLVSTILPSYSIKFRIITPWWIWHNKYNAGIGMCEAPGGRRRCTNGFGKPPHLITNDIAFASLSIFLWIVA